VFWLSRPRSHTQFLNQGQFQQHSTHKDWKHRKCGSPEENIESIIKRKENGRWMAKSEKCPLHWHLTKWQLLLLLYVFLGHLQNPIKPTIFLKITLFNTFTQKIYWLPIWDIAIHPLPLLQGRHNEQFHDISMWNSHLIFMNLSFLVTF